MADKLVRKRCNKCGGASMVPPRQRRCRAVSSRMGSQFWCYGFLTLAPIQRTPKLAVERRPQEIAALEGDKAQRKIAEHLTSIKRLMTAIDGWQRKAAYYAKRAAMSDADLAAEKAARLERQQAKARSRKTRAIELEG